MNAARLGRTLVLLVVFSGCDTTRKQECERLLSALKPLDVPAAPSPSTVDDVNAAIRAIDFQDQPLREYASSTKATLTVLASTLRLQQSDSPPDGTDDLVKDKVKEVRGEKDDITRYCAE